MDYLKFNIHILPKHPSVNPCLLVVKRVRKSEME